MSSLPYIPVELPLNNLAHRLLLPLVGRANAALARFTGVLQSCRPGTVNCVRLRRSSKGCFTMPDPSLIPADYAPLLAEINARVRHIVPHAVAQLEGEAIVPQTTAAALCVLTETVFVFPRIKTSKQEVS